MTALAAPPASDRMRRFEKACEILDRFDRDPSRLVPILQAVQETYRYLPERVLAFVASSLGIPAARVYGVATFYAHFTLTPRGKYVVRLCDGTACHVRGSNPILDALRKHLALEPGQDTTPDMLFTVQTVSCLGACGLAPVMVVNDDVHGQMTPESAVAVIEDIAKKENER